MCDLLGLALVTEGHDFGLNNAPWIPVHLPHSTRFHAFLDVVVVDWIFRVFEIYKITRCQKGRIYEIYKITR
jgi:hypothetical protein